MGHHVYTQIIAESIERNADRPCFHVKRDGQYRSWTYRQFGRDLQRAVSRLQGIGFRKGDRGTIIGANTPEWVIAYHAVVFAGGCAVPVDPQLPYDEIREIVNQTKPTIVFCSAIFKRLFSELRAELDAPSIVVVLDPDAGDDSWDRFIAQGTGTGSLNGEGFFPDDLLAIVFTSGTTGLAKGVALNQRNFTAVSQHGVPRMRVAPGDTMIAFLPLHHVFGFAACVAATFCTGLDVVFVPVVKGPLIVEALKDRRVSILPAVPQMLEIFYDNIMRAVSAKGALTRILFSVLTGLSASVGTVLGRGFRRRLFSAVHRGFGGNLRLIVSGASSLRPKYFRGFGLLGFDIVEGYGLTETFGPITICPAHDPRQGSVGPVLPGNEMRIDQPGPDGIGEVLFRGETVFSGYYRNPQATAGVFDADGWFHTGDLGRLDDDRFLYLTGRCKDVIVLDSGKNVYPDELEEYYRQSALIGEIAVFGAKEGDRETVSALIVPSDELRRQSVEAAWDAIGAEIARMGQSLPTYKKIGAFAVTFHPLPRTTTRKLKKREIQEIYALLRTGKTAPSRSRLALSYIETTQMQSEEFGILRDHLLEISPQLNPESITPRSHLELDLMIDSLKAVDLVTRIEERFAISIPDGAFVKAQTLGDIVSLIAELRMTEACAARETESSVRFPASPVRHHALILRSAANITQWLGRTYWGLRVEGGTDIPTDRAVIFAANHQSLVDSVWLIGALPWHIRRRTYALAKEELTRIPLLGRVFRWANIIPVERRGDVSDAVKAAQAILDSGNNLIIFPEGTRSRTGLMAPFKAGVGVLMQRTGCCCVPVRIVHTAEVWKPGRSLPSLVRRNKDLAPRLIFGKPLTVDDLIASGKVGPTPSGQEIADALADSITKAG